MGKKRKYSERDVRDLMQMASDEASLRTVDHLLQEPTPGNIHLAREIILGMLETSAASVKMVYGIQPRLDLPADTSDPETTWSTHCTE